LRPKDRNPLIFFTLTLALSLTGRGNVQLSLYHVSSQCRS
jgi:hypothetical protein